MITAVAALLAAALAGASSSPPAAPKNPPPSDAPRATAHVPVEMDRWLIKGVDEIYRMRWDDAEASARKAMEIDPEHPFAYMGLAGVAWTKYVYGTDQGDPSLLKVFDERIQKTIEVAEKWVKKHPRDPGGLMTLGSTYGLASRLAIVRRQWVKGYWLGRKAISITRRSVAVDPEYWDGYLGLGMYDYYSDALPRAVGVLAKLVLRGDRLRGIETLKTVAEKGHYSRSNARILLVEILLEDKWGARDPAKAVELVKSLRATYPDSAMMHSAEFVALYEAGRFADVAESAREYLSRVDKGLYAPIEAGKGFVALGCALWQLGKLEEAREAFGRAQTIELDGRLTRWAVWSHIRAGQLEDSIGRREEALKHYKEAAAQPDTWEFRELAKSGLAKPFPSGAKPGPIPPSV